MTNAKKDSFIWTGYWEYTPEERESLILAIKNGENISDPSLPRLGTELTKPGVWVAPNRISLPTFAVLDTFLIPGGRTISLGALIDVIAIAHEFPNHTVSHRGVAVVAKDIASRTDSVDYHKARQLYRLVANMIEYFALGGFMIQAIQKLSNIDSQTSCSPRCQQLYDHSFWLAIESVR